MWNKGARRASRTARLLMLLGVAAQLAAIFALGAGAPLIQYAACAPEVQKIEEAQAGGEAGVRYESGLEALCDARDGVAETMGDALSALSLSALKSGVALSAGEGGSAVASLWAVDGRFIETRPRPLAAGRWMDGAEIESGARVAVVDEDLAFALFGSEDALGAQLRVGGKDYRVIGVARHRRGVGEADEFAAYIPLGAASAQGLQMDVVELSALPAAQGAVSQSFRSAAQSALGEGSFHDLRREAMGALLLTRMIAGALGLALVWRLGRRLARLARGCARRVGALRARGYARTYLPPALLYALLIALGAAALAAAAYGLLSFMVEPVYSFTEWVPESLVKLSALQTVFWDRTADAARLVRVATPESATAAFWGTIARLGGFALLLGLALRKKKMELQPEIGNRSENIGV